MKLGECTVQGKPRTDYRIVDGRRVVTHLPKRYSCSADARHFYHKELFPGGETDSNYHRPGPQKSPFQRNPR